MSEESITINTGREISEKWDSIGHISLVLAIEAEFGVKFSAAEIAALDSVSSIMSKLQDLGAS